MSMFRASLRRAFSAGVAAFAILSGCTAFDTPDTFNRHRFSDITEPRDRTDIFYFDASVTAEFPDNDAAGEAERMRWLTEWMEQRHMCPTGYEIVKKRKFDFTEDNPAHRDLRYEARCKAG